METNKTSSAVAKATAAKLLVGIFGSGLLL